MKTIYVTVKYNSHWYRICQLLDFIVDCGR